MRSIKLSIIALCLAGSSAFAQSNEPVISNELVAIYKSGTSDDIAKMQTDKMKEYLALSESQYTDVYNLNMRVADKVRAIQENTSFDDAKKKEFIEGNLLDRRRAMSQILTEGQFKLFDEEEYQ